MIELSIGGVVKVSLILPIYNEEKILAEVLEKYIRDMKGIAEREGGDYEIIAVNDGCTDHSTEILLEHARNNRKIRIVNLEYRSGKQAAITAGFEVAGGDAVILADIDLLNPVGVLQKLINEYKAGHQIVYAYREGIGFEDLKHRASFRMVSMAARFFGVEGHYTGKANIALYARDVADVLVALPNKNKYLRTMDNWTGYEVRPIMYASNYNKIEIREKMRDAKALDREQGVAVKRSAVREHSPSRVYSVACVVLALIFIGIWVGLSQSVGLNFLWNIVCVMILGVLVLLSALFYIRSVMIKRIGIIHSDTDEAPYVIKNIVN